MKKQDLRKIIREEIKVVLKEEQFNNQRIMIEIRNAIMKVVKKYQDISPRKEVEPNLKNLADVVAHSALNVVKYLDNGSYMV